MVASGPLSLRRFLPSKLRTARTASWYILWPMIFLHMALVIKLSPLPTGSPFISSSVGGSVARANAPRVSIIKFTQSNCTAVKGADPESKWENHYSCSLKFQFLRKSLSLFIKPVMHAETKLITRATTLTVNWNCTNFWMFMYTARPHLATLTIVEKLSSIIITSAFSLATCEP